MITDAELVETWRRGSEKALDELLERYQDKIFSYLYRITGTSHDAEEAVQETFVKVIRSLGKYREEGHFKAWLFRIAHREGLRVIRKKTSRKSLVQFAETGSRIDSDPVDPFAGPLEQLLRSETADIVDKAVAQLPEKERQVILLRFYSELSFRDIAQIMACPINTALGRMRNASFRLRSMLLEQKESR